MKPFLILLALLTCSSSYALEIHPGDTFEGEEVLKLLKAKLFNLDDPLCLKKTVLDSQLHQAEIATGSHVTKVEFLHHFYDPNSGKKGTVPRVSYSDGDALDFSACFLLPENLK